MNETLFHGDDALDYQDFCIHSQAPRYSGWLRKKRFKKILCRFEIRRHISNYMRRFQQQRIIRHEDAIFLMMPTVDTSLVQGHGCSTYEIKSCASSIVKISHDRRRGYNINE